MIIDNDRLAGKYIKVPLKAIRENKSLVSKSSSDKSYRNKAGAKRALGFMSAACLLFRKQKQVTMPKIHKTKQKKAFSRNIREH